MIIKETDDYNLQKLKNFNLPIITSVNHLLKLLDISPEEEKKYLYSDNRKKNLYYEYNIPKKNGGVRKIEVPDEKIKLIQKAINRVILSNFNMPQSCMGYMKGKSIVDNALPHVSAITLMKFDIKNFFPTINLKKVVGQFRYFGYGKNVSKYLGYLCVNKDFCLPQGAPTSPMLSNLVCIKLDKRIEAFCKKYNLNYTRYADDITISSLEKLSRLKCEYIKSFVDMVIVEEGFIPNQEKYRRFVNGQALKVTGITVNTKANVDKKIIRELENAIRYILKYGLDSHLNRINYDSDIDYTNHLYGLAFYIKMVDKDKGLKYIEELKKLRLSESLFGE